MPAPGAERGLRGLTVVKLGGSLAKSPQLKGCLDAIAASPGRLVLVPGGGPFADQVRDLQAHWRFDEPLAHHLAIMAMELFGRLLTGLGPNLVPAGSRAAIRRALADGFTPVWLPSAMVIGRPDIPESWAVTSDSLAAWLAAHLGARRLVLIKSRRPRTPTAAVETLVRDGLIDPAFPALFPDEGCRTWCLAADESQALTALLTGRTAGTEILPRGGADD